MNCCRTKHILVRDLASPTNTPNSRTTTVEWFNCSLRLIWHNENYLLLANSRTRRLKCTQSNEKQSGRNQSHYHVSMRLRPSARCSRTISYAFAAVRTAIYDCCDVLYFIGRFRLSTSNNR